MPLTLRHADPARDGASCAAIYEHYVTATSATFEERPPTAADFAQRIAQTSLTHPWLVLDDGGRVVGYAYASQHRPRAAYRWAADVAIYVDAGHRRRGVGRRLYGALLELMRRQNLRIACAGVTLPNEASVALHRAVGFEHVGVFRSIGWKGGGWRDVAWYALQLSPDREDGGGPPAEPGPPARLPAP